MAKVIYVCSRNREFHEQDEILLKRICQELTPDNITSSVKHRVFRDKKVACAIINDQPSVLQAGNSLLLGYLYDGATHWSEPLQPSPDGSYALFRDSADYFEGVSDAAASRTVWYCLDEQWFICSTSQRAIITFLGSFQFNEKVIPWMLSTGSLGPSLSWDKRLHTLPPDASVVLDKQSWSISCQVRPGFFAPHERADCDHLQRLKECLVQTLTSLGRLDWKRWVLPLSGGYDSRGLLCFLVRLAENPGQLRAVTWGLESSLAERYNDARIAKDLAAKLGVAHRYYHTDLSREPIELIVRRFLLCGEGRIDHLQGYMDGFALWRDLLEDGVQGIIRGDEGFGWRPVSNPLGLRYRLACCLCSDYSNLKGIGRLGIPDQEWPADFRRQGGESLAAWRDRLFHAFCLPTILAALSDLKSPYVEPINPLLSRLILRQVRELPDHLRTEKYLFRQIVESISPDVPYATSGANAEPEDILGKKDMIACLMQELDSEQRQSIFSDDFLAFVIAGMSRGSVNKKGMSSSLRRRLQRSVPRLLEDFIRDRLVGPRLRGNVLAFRVFLILRMTSDLRLAAVPGSR